MTGCDGADRWEQRSRPRRHTRRGHGYKPAQVEKGAEHVHRQPSHPAVGFRSPEHFDGYQRRWRVPPATLLPPRICKLDRRDRMRPSQTIAELGRNPYDKQAWGRLVLAKRRWCSRYRMPDGSIMTTPMLRYRHTMLRDRSWCNIYLWHPELLTSGLCLLPGGERATQAREGTVNCPALPKIYGPEIEIALEHISEG
jgi:hypothetical protein